MKRIFYSCLFFVFICTGHILQAQGTFTATPNPLCPNPTNTYTVALGVVAQNAAVQGAGPLGGYSWTITGPCGVTSATVPAPGLPNGTSMVFTTTCCGEFTVLCEGIVNGFPVGPLTFNTTTPFNWCAIGGMTTVVIPCASYGTVTASNPIICSGSSSTLSASPAANSWLWSNGGNTSTIAVTPSVQTCFSYTSTLSCPAVGPIPGGTCVSVPASVFCVSVQAVTATLSPANQTMCAGSPVSFTANTTVLTTTANTGGTSISSYTWFSPPPPPGGAFISSGTPNNITTPAVGGTYSVVLSHTGAAGTCTTQSTASVTIGANVSMSVTPSATSACPGGTVQLTAVSAPTTGASYTWTLPGGVTVTGNPVTVTLPGNLNTVPATYTVDVSYGGCPGHATVQIVAQVLTPTLTSSAGLSTCPNRSLQLTASGALTYTFTRIPNGFVAPGFVIPTAPNTATTATTTPTGANLPIQYCVSTASAGCTGSTCITVTTRTLFPVLTASSNSICPGTAFTLTSTTNGTNTSAPTNYTFTAPYAPANFSIGLNNVVTHTAQSFTGPGFAHTYTVTADSASCRGTGTITIGLLALTPTLGSSSPSVCPNSTITLKTSTWTSGATYTFLASAPNFTNSSTSTVIIAGSTSTVTHAPPISGTATTPVTYTVQVDSAGCKGSATYSIGLLNLGPTVTFTSLPATGSVCPGTTFTLQAKGALSYSFYAPPSVETCTPDAPSGLVTVTCQMTAPASIGAGQTYTLVADSGGCRGTKTLIIHEYELKPTITATPTLICKGITTTLTVGGVGSNTTNPTTYTFSSFVPPALPSTLSAGTSTSTTHSPTVPTIYGVVADSMGCKTPLVNTPTVLVNIRPDLVLLPSTVNQSVCPGLATTLSVVAPTTALSYTYTWSQTAGTTTTINPAGSTPTVVTYPITNSTYSISVLDSLGCVGNTVISVGVDPALSFSMVLATSGSTICSGQSVTLTAAPFSTVQTIGIINYTWTPGASLSPTSVGVSTVVASPSISTLYTVLGDNGYGCVSQNTISVPVGQYPNLHANPPAVTAQSVCTGFTSTITAFGALSYTWSSTQFSTPISQTSISVGQGIYSLTASNGGGCTKDTFIVIGTASPLNIQITAVAPTPTTCITSNFPKFSKPVHLTASGAGTYVWFPYNPNYMTYSLGPQTDVRPPATTQYTVIGSTAICAGQKTITVVVIPQFSINVTPPLPALCLGDSLKLSISNFGPGAFGPVSAYTYSWTEPLNAPPISVSSYFTPTVMSFPQNTSTYSVETRDARDCISFPRLVTVTVLPRPLTAIAIPTINNVATNTVCYVGLNPGAQDVTINLTGNNENIGLQFGIVPTYTWISPYSSAYNSILTPVNNNAVTVNAPLRLPSVVVYTLISGYNGVPGCKRADTVSVRVIDCRPVRGIKFTTAEPVDTICAKKCVTFVNLTDTMAGGPQKLEWTFEGGAPKSSTLNVPTVCYNVANKKAFSVILKVSNPYPIINPEGGVPGSTLSTGVLNYVQVMDIPNVTIIAPGQVRSDTTVRFGQSVSLSGSGAMTYNWYPGYNITSLTNPKVTVNPFKTTQYILSGFNSKGCSSSDTINVIVVEDCGEMYVPNAFTPNNDGTNDVLFVRGICLQSLTFMVFNRWGEKVFETAEQSIGWDGTYKGEALNTGVFVYRLEGKTYDGKAFSSKGNVTLIK